MQNSAFVHLQCQSEYSVKNSLIRVPKLIEGIKQAGMNAVALTDDISLFSAVKFYQKARSAGVKPLFGAKMSLSSDEGRYDVLLLCQNHQGYLNLSELISKAYLNQQGIEGPSITEAELGAYHTGLLLIATPVSSDVAQLLLTNQALLAPFSSAETDVIVRFLTHVIELTSDGSSVLSSAASSSPILQEFDQ